MTKIARFRLRNEMKKGSYWEIEEKRRCRLCGWEEESWEHVVEVYMGEGKDGGKEEILRILEDDGRGESWMKRLQDRRELREKGMGRRGEKTETDGNGRMCERVCGECRREWRLKI